MGSSGNWTKSVIACAGVGGHNWPPQELPGGEAPPRVVMPGHTQPHAPIVLIVHADRFEVSTADITHRELV